MARLYRPHIPLSVRILVATRQCYQAGFNPPAREEGESLASLLGRQLSALAIARGCTPKDFRLDHDPPLGARPRSRKGLGKKTYYIPDANDPDHLFYRPHGAQFDGSHDVKTRIRGDHGQYSDIALIKRERRRQKKKAAKPLKRDVRFRQKIKAAKRPWPSRPFPKRSKP